MELGVVMAFCMERECVIMFWAKASHFVLVCGSSYDIPFANSIHYTFPHSSHSHICRCLKCMLLLNVCISGCTRIDHSCIEALERRS